MANHTTGAQRHNARMEKIFDRAKSEGRGLVGNSHVDGAGVNSSAMKKARKEFDAKKKSLSTKKSSKKQWHHKMPLLREGIDK